VATAAIETSRAEAIADPTVMDNALFRAEGAARALHAGQPPEAVEAGVRTAGGSVVAGVIGDRLARNDPQGVRLFRQYADRLDPADRRTLGAAAETLSNTLDAAAWLRERSATLRMPAPTGDAALDAVNAASGSTAEPPRVISSAGTLLDPDSGILGTRERLAEIEDRRRALTALNRQEFAANPARLRANQTAIDTDTARSRAAVKAEADTLYADLRRHLTTGGPTGGPAITPPPATIMSRLTDAQQDAVIATINRSFSGIKTRTDPQTFYAIHQGLTGDDAGERDRWASKNLAQFVGQLSDEDLAGLEKLQTVVRSGGAEQRRLQAITRMANDTLRTAGVDPTPRPDAPAGSDAEQAARFSRLVHDELLAFESRGRKPTKAEAYGIVNGLKDTTINSGRLEVGDSRPSPAVDSDIPSIDDTIHEPGAELAQAGPPDGATGATRSDTAATEPDPGSDVYRDADRQARGIVAEQEIQEIENDRAVSRWMMGIRPGAPVAELPKEIAERLRPGQQEEIQDVIDAGAASRSDPATFKEIFFGLTSDDAGQRLKWARESLLLYRPKLSEKDFANLVLIQRNISARDGVPIEGVGYPLGTLDDHAELVAALLGGGAGGTAVIASAGRIAVLIARQAVRAGRWALEKIKGKDEPPAGKNVPTEGANPTGMGGLAGEAAEIAATARQKVDSTVSNPVPRPGGGTDDDATGNDVQPSSPSSGGDAKSTLPTNEARIRHMFRASRKGGHLSDTPQNRQRLVDMANDRSALLGTDEHGNTWYGKKLPDGTQIWAQVRGNVIINGGLNQTEKTFHPQTGLSAPEIPNKTKSP
jgi:hypothetical protein